MKSVLFLIVVALVIVAAFILGPGVTSGVANKKCAPYGGVLSTDARAGTVVCNDHTSRSLYL